MSEQEHQSLIAAWDNLEESIKRSIFQAIYSVDKKIFAVLARSVTGFKPATLAKRPPMVKAALDRHLFALRDGKLAMGAMTAYFVRARPRLDREFCARFVEMARADRSLTAHQIATEILAAMSDETDEPGIVALYEAALRVFFPHRFDDNPPDIAEVHKSKTTELVDEIDVAAEGDTAAAGAEDREQDTTMHEPLTEADSTDITAEIETEEAAETNATNSHADAAVEASSKLDLHTQEARQKLVASVVSSLESAPFSEVIADLDMLAGAIRELNKLREEWDTHRADLERHHDELEAKGFGSAHLFESEFARSVDGLRLEDAIARAYDRLQRIAAFGDRLLRIESLRREICRGFDVDEIRALADDLEGWIKALDDLVRATQIEVDHIKQSRSLLLDFDENMQACDYEAALSYVKETRAAQWQALIRAALSATSQCSDESYATDQDEAAIARVIGSVFTDEVLLGLIIRTVWKRSPRIARTILEDLSEAQSASNTPPLWIALAGLNWDQLLKAADHSAALADNITILAICVLVRGCDVRIAQWLGTLRHLGDPDPRMVVFIDELVKAVDRGRPVEEITLLVEHTPDSDLVTKNRAKSLEVLEHHARQSGWGGNYRRLRDNVQRQFIEPVMDLVRKGRHSEALAGWRSKGDIEAMVHWGVQQYPPIQRIEKKHQDRTSQYLERFEELLQRWGSACRESSAPPEPFVHAYDQLLKVGSIPLTAVDLTWRDLLAAQLDGRTNEGAIVPRQFGLRRVALDRVERANMSPFELESWIVASQSEDDCAPTASVLAERLLDLLNPAHDDETASRLLKQFVERNELLAASLFVERQPECAAEFEQIAEDFEREFVTRHKELVERAELYAPTHPTIKGWLDLMRQTLSEFNAEEAQQAAEVLAEEITRVQTEDTEEYSQTVEILEEAGVEVVPGASLDDLGDRLARTREESRSRREHIIYLHKIADSSSFPLEFTRPITSILEVIDRPAFWQEPSDSANLREALTILIDFIDAKGRRQKKRPADYKQLIHFVSLLLHNGLTKPPTSERGQAGIKAIANLAMEIEFERLEMQEVIEWAASALAIDIPDGEALPDRLFWEPVEPSPVTATEPVAGRPSSAPASLESVVGRIRERLASLAAKADAVETPRNAFRILREYQKNANWHEAMFLALHLAVREPIEDEWPQPIESLACVACLNAMVSNGVDIEHDSWIDLLLGVVAFLVVHDPSAPSVFLDAREAQECLIATLCNVWQALEASDDDNEERRRYIVRALDDLSRNRDLDPRYKWTYGLFTAARALVVNGAPLRGSHIVADTIWDEMTGLDQSARARATFLKLGYFMGLQDDFVKHLAAKHAKTYDHILVQYFKALRGADTSDLAWNDARRLAQSFLEQVPSGRYKPWRLLVDDLNQMRKESDSGDLCAISLENFTRLGNSRFLLEICLTPNKYAILTSLLLKLVIVRTGGEDELPNIQLLDDEGEINREFICRREIDIGAESAAENSIALAYELEIDSATGRRMQIRSTWSVDVNSVPPQPIPSQTVSRCWSGADGEPVDSTSNAFHGRQNEIEQIHDLLKGQDGRQRSAVVIGQRRIGKTSVLRETLHQYPPSQGRVCSIYCQFGGISRKYENEPLTKTVFDILTECGDETGYNSAFRELMANRLGPRWNKKLRSGLAESSSVGNALDRFVQRILRHTDGMIRRVAFLADEFQGIFKFDRAEVNDVMWGLRPMVQSSPRISLILAGSGLTRKLIRDYDQALFGSIKTIELGPFELPEDRDAIANTVMPLEVRDQLCPDKEMLDKIVAHTHRLTGGHPWFLTLLGRWAAVKLDGRPLTVPLINEVARAMMSTSVGIEAFGGAERFYGHLFHTMEDMGELGSIAQLILVNIAKQVTMELPDLRPNQAVSGPMIENTGISREDCLKALSLLKEEKILDLRPVQGETRCRIRVPLVAEAIRYDADDIEYRSKLALGEI